MHPTRRDEKNTRPPSDYAAETAIMADVLNAPDPYDGAAPADIYGVGIDADNTPKQEVPLRETAARFGLCLAQMWLLDNGYKAAAIELNAATDEIILKKLGGAS